MRETLLKLLGFGGAYIITFFTGIVPAMIATGVLIGVDTIAGIWAALRSGEKFSSRKFGNLAAKMVLYQALIISAHAIDLYMIHMPVFLYATTSGLAMIEFSSIVEKVDKATGIDLWALLKDKIARLNQSTNETIKKP